MMDFLTTIVAPEGSLYSITSLTKRKRKPAGTPDPDAEVIALSPQTLMEAESYVCEICNQGFQRDQNLQMHRRRHKVPWKLLKRVEPENRKRVYVCPEPSCLHHDPCHALGDMVGIKKHYRRKHSSMKQWKCDKCSKAYAVQSDFKAHLKTCGTRGHCCDCGRVFSRIESFIEHQDTCAAPRQNKKQSLTDEREAASLRMADDQNHSGIPFHPLQAQPASAPPTATRKAQTCVAIPAVAPTPPLSPASLCQRTTHHTALSTHSTQDESIWWPREQSCIKFHSSPDLQHYSVPELQLLPTSKDFLNRVESSQGSDAWRKAVNLTGIDTAAPNPVENKCRREGVNYLEMPECVDYLDILPLSGVASTDATTPAACELQLCIGVSDSNQPTYNGKGTSLHYKARIRTYDYEEVKPEQVDSEDVSRACAAWHDQKPLPMNVSDACLDVAVPTTRGEVVKKHSSLGRLSHEISCSQYLETNGAERGLSELLQPFNSMCKPVGAIPDTGADLLPSEQSDSSSVSMKNPDSVLSTLLHTESTRYISQKQSFLLNPDRMEVPAAEALQVLLQEASQKLRKASAEKLDAEKAWREARKEREQAEQELAKAQRIAEHNAREAIAVRLGADHLQLALQIPDEGERTRKSTCSSSRSSSPCSSIANSQAATSSLQVRQVYEAGSLSPTCRTCPTCLNTQILYPSEDRSNSMGNLFL